MYRVSPHIVQFAWALAAGVVSASLWVNLDPASYYDAMEFRLWAPHISSLWGLPDPIFSLQFITAQALMPLFIALIAKEVWEALVLPQGAFARAQRRIVPMTGVLGGVLGAVLVWWALPFGSTQVFGLDPWAGWPLPIGSDVVLCYVFGTWAFGKGHPALHHLLVMAAGFDILSLGCLAVSGATQGLRLWGVGLSLLALIWIWRFSSRHARPDATEVAHRRAALLWPYAVAAALCWAGFVLAGLPGALGLLPLIPLVPHAGHSFGLFAEAEDILHDPLNRLAHILAKPVMLALFLFGLTQGALHGAEFAALTPRILAALWLGKPLGMLVGAMIGARFSAKSWPEGISRMDLGLIALLLGMGVSLPLLALETALPAGLPADQVRIGLASSLAIGVIAVALGRAFGRKGLEPRDRKG